MTETLVRTVVLDTAARVFDRGELVDRALDRALRAHKSLHSRERRLVGEALYAWVRGRRRGEYLLAAVPAVRWERLSTPDRQRWMLAWSLADGCAQPVRDAVRLAGLTERDASILEGALRQIAAWPGDPVQALAVRHSVSDMWAQRFHAELGAEAEPCLEALGERAPLVLRANSLKVTRDGLLEALAGEGVAATAGRWSPWAVQLQGRPNVFGLQAYKQGLFEVQDEGSQLIALAVGARPGACVVDACAGGGGKTLALAAAMGNSGRLVACDIAEGRLADLPERARRAGVFCLQPRVVPAGPGEHPVLTDLRGRAHSVLVDAPCSGTGAWRRNPDARWRTTEEELQAFPSLQLSILQRYATLVRPGGRLIYATCSLLQAENESVVEAFLSANKSFAIVDAGVDPSCRQGPYLRTWPHRHGTDGFFAAVLKRV